MAKKVFVAPDGGWGWMVVLGAGIATIFTAPVLQNFTLIYGSKFPEMGMSAIELSIIINVNQAFGMLLSLLNVPLLRRFGFRKISIIGNLLYSSGLIFTSYATNFTHFIITFGMINSFGLTMSAQATTLALNTYFKERRGHAVGICLMISGLGLTVVPRVLSSTLPIYGSKGSMLILGGMTLNHVVGSLLLHPIEWHAKPAEDTEGHSKNTTSNMVYTLKNSYIFQETMANNAETEKKEANAKNHQIATISGSKLSHSLNVYENVRTQSLKDECTICAKEWLPKINNLGTALDKNVPNNLAIDNFENVSTKRSNSLNTIKLRKISFISLKVDMSSVTNKIKNTKEHNEEFKNSNDINEVKSGIVRSSTSAQGAEDTFESLSSSQYRPLNLIRKLILLFDLELLSDGVYMMIMLAVSLTVYAEVNFSSLMPLIFEERNLNLDDIATMLIIHGIADIVFRGLSPYVGSWLRQSPMVLFLTSIGISLVVKIVLLFTSSYTAVLFVSISLGVAKGLRIVYMNVLIPNYVPLEKLVAASCIQTLIGGCISLFASPILGLIKDVTGNYDPCIVFINIISIIIMIMVLFILIIQNIRNRKNVNSFYDLSQVPRRCNFDCTCCFDK